LPAPSPDRSLLPPSQKTGVIAQEVQHIVPEAVRQGGCLTLPSGEKISDVLMVDRDMLQMITMGSVQEMADKMVNELWMMTTLERKCGRHMPLHFPGPSPHHLSVSPTTQDHLVARMNEMEANNALLLNSIAMARSIADVREVAGSILHPHDSALTLGDM
jgi:hypothetical protein